MTYVTCPILRYHTVVAQKAATMQILSHGRFRLGLGAGESLSIPSDPSRPIRRPRAGATFAFTTAAADDAATTQPPEIEQWAQRLHRWRATQELFVYFNNNWEGFAPNNALLLGKRLTALAAESRASS